MRPLKFICASLDFYSVHLLSSTADHAERKLPQPVSLLIKAVVNFYIIISNRTDWSYNFGDRSVILVVPVKVLCSFVHSFDSLTLEAVGHDQHKWRDSGEGNGNSGISVRTAAVFDFSVTVIVAIWNYTAFFVLVGRIFVVPDDVCVAV